MIGVTIMDCSKTDIFAKEWERMCESFGKTSCSEKCPIWGLKSRPSMDCFMAFFENPEIVIQEVQKWSDENPKEIDWSKVPRGTEVYVWNNLYGITYHDKIESYFLGILGSAADDRKFIVYGNGLNEEHARCIEVWENCELAPFIDPTPYLKE